MHWTCNIMDQSELPVGQTLVHLAPGAQATIQGPLASGKAS